MVSVISFHQKCPLAFGEKIMNTPKSLLPVIQGTVVILPGCIRKLNIHISDLSHPNGRIATLLERKMFRMQSSSHLDSLASRLLLSPSQADVTFVTNSTTLSAQGLRWCTWTRVLRLWWSQHWRSITTRRIRNLQRRRTTTGLPSKKRCLHQPLNNDTLSVYLGS